MIDRDMKCPAVSHELWERTRGLAQIRMGTFDIDSGQLSYARKVDMLIELRPAAFLEEVEGEEEKYDHPEWTDGVQVPIYPDERDRRHRPEIPDGTLDDLDEWVEEQYPELPVDALDFEEKMQLLVDTAQEWYAALDCHLIPGEEANDLRKQVEELARGL